MPQHAGKAVMNNRLNTRIWTYAPSKAQEGKHTAEKKAEHSK